MLKILSEKLKESFASVLPVTLIVLVLSFTPLVSFSTKELLVFAVSAVFLVVGIGLFNLGADLAMTPMGVQVGTGLSRSKNVGILLSVSFLLSLMPSIKVSSFVVTF